MGGVLIVNGDLTINGNFEYDGLILVKGHFKANGTLDVFGAVLVQGTTDILGNANFSYSSCAVTNAFAGLSTPSRTKQRFYRSCCRNKNSGSREWPDVTTVMSVPPTRRNMPVRDDWVNAVRETAPTRTQLSMMRASQPTEP